MAVDVQPVKMERTANASTGVNVSNGRTPEGMP
jgi:hypothetical protein